MKFSRFAAFAHGLYYLLTGLWPIASMESFVIVTGPKTDYWLVRMVGLLAMAIGLPLISAGFRNRITWEVALLGCLAAISFAAVDIYYALAGVISKIYFLDATAEIPLFLYWLIYLVKRWDRR